MENQECQIEELSFQPGNQHQTKKQRKILQSYSRLDYDKQRKTKFEFFNKESIQGLLTVFQINHNRMDFIIQQQLITQLNIFMSNAKKITLKIYEQINVKYNQFYILFQGCLIKKQDHQPSLGNSYIPQLNKKNRPSSRTKTWATFEQCMSKGNQALLYTAMNPRKIQKQHTAITSNHEMSPRTIYYDPLDKRSYECRSDCILFQFPKLCLQKFQSWIQNKQKQGLVSFMSACFGVQDQKGLSKLIQKTIRLKKNNKQNLSIDSYTIYLIHIGEVLVKTKYYSIHLNKNSIIYKDCHFDEFIAQTKSFQTSLISISLTAMVQLLQQSFPTLLQDIKKKLNSLHNQRLQLLAQTQIHLSQPPPIQPIFNTRILNIKSFQKQRKYEWLNQIQQKNQNHKYHVTTPKTPNSNSARFKIDPNANKQNIIQSEFAMFLSNYPYQKLVQSQIKLNQTIRRPTSNSIRKFPIIYQAITQQQRKKVQRQKKKIYYMNKVRKLKIRNIVQKQIPNLCKNKYDVEAAQRQMFNNSIFTNIIEYPMNGISQGAKDSINKNISKMIKMTETNSKIKTIQRKYLSETNAQYDQPEIQKHSIRAFSLQSDSNFDANLSQKQHLISKQQKCNMNKNSTNDSEIQNQLKTVSFLIGNNFSSHLPTQKDIKYKPPKTFHNFIDHEKRTNLPLKAQISKKTTHRNQTNSLQKLSCIIITMPQTTQINSITQSINL